MMEVGTVKLSEETIAFSLGDQKLLRRYYEKNCIFVTLSIHTKMWEKLSTCSSKKRSGFNWVEKTCILDLNQT